MRAFKNYIPESKLKLHLEYHHELNPKLWDKKARLKPEVRHALLKFAEHWQEFANIPKEAVKDVIMTGGNANYNYTSVSDIDVHLIVDKQKISKDNPLLDDYLQDKKVMWTMAHKIKVLGYPLEPYAQDKSAGYPANQGVYSLTNDLWISKPEYLGDEMLSDPLIKDKVKFYMHMIDDMITSHANINAFKELKEKLRLMRAAAIQKGGEFSTENLVFKELRNRGYLDKMSKYSKQIQDRALSLE